MTPLEETLTRVLPSLLGFVGVAGVGWLLKRLTTFVKEWRDESKTRNERAEERSAAALAKIEQATEIAAKGLEAGTEAVQRLDRMNGSVGRIDQAVRVNSERLARLEGTVYGNKALEVSKE